MNGIIMNYAAVSGTLAQVLAKLSAAADRVYHFAVFDCYFVVKNCPIVGTNLKTSTRRVGTANACQAALLALTNR
jgi:hypothetical protein